MGSPGFRTAYYDRRDGHVVGRPALTSASQGEMRPNGEEWIRPCGGKRWVY
ncbi:hypothetical protein GCM10027445_58890 [Amycolatopsis endophytica]